MDRESQQTKPVCIAGRRALKLSVSRFKVRVEDGPDRGKSALLSGASLCVGTDPECDLRLTDPAISRRHVLFASTPLGVKLEDLGSTNGTWLAGARVDSAVIPDQSLLRAGSSALRVTLAPGDVVVFPEESSSFAGMAGATQTMRDLFAVVDQLAKTDLPVLITGETGSGKELVARAIHECGPRQKRRFVVLDCASVVPGLMRSEIFGHEKGAFTGADEVSCGVLEEADGGTVFLDEVGEIDLSVQPNLLRALETRQISRLGSRQILPVDFRVVAATHRDLSRMVQESRFREDLYYRLACFTIRVPPLRERLDDISLLASGFLDGYAKRNGVPAPELTGEAIDALRRYSWPGNVRQLKNAIEAMCAVSLGNPVLACDVEKVLGWVVPDPAPSGPSGPVSLCEAGDRRDEAPGRQSLDEAEREVIVRALKATGWKKKPAARLLGISHTTLFERLRRYGIKDPSPESR